MTKRKSKNPKFGKLGIEQGILKARLHEYARLYIKYRRLKALGVKPEIPITLVAMQRLQAEINRIRRQVGLKPIAIYQNMRKQLKHL